MKKKIVYEIKGLYRDNFRVTGFEFGEGKKALCIVGSMRGNEVQQLYCCSLLVKKFKQLEEEGRISPDIKILIIPCSNPYSMNIQKRFWPIDNTDINRMFPGYNLGETTQRIASGVFEEIKEYERKHKSEKKDYDYSDRVDKEMEESKLRSLDRKRAIREQKKKER